ncbi:pyridoxamine 5'-phosphate oxidase family protein [uncultured Croceitalea sp.]|uniref:pyridoxamine 5'-phosphate oxidase family protein n=1 Tax=uncultured Croceitalea sp. TaxID=1798908 RepID=UPI00374E478D
MIKDIEPAECLEMLKNNYLGHLGYVSGKSPFVVPITYFYDIEENSILSYSSNGHKIEAMRDNKVISLQVENIQSIQNWKSLQVHGLFEELLGSTAKKYLHKFALGVQATIEHSNGKKPKFISDFSIRLQERQMPIVYRINIIDIIGKTRVTKE